MENYNKDNIKYLQAKKRIKQIKGFYIHALVFVLVNILLIFINHQKTGNFEFKNFWGSFFWGIGLASHGLSVFLPNFFLGKNWEEKKIREIMEKNKNQSYSSLLLRETKQSRSGKIFFNA